MIVLPANAGIQYGCNATTRIHWIPAFAGMTDLLALIKPFGCGYAAMG